MKAVLRQFAWLAILAVASTLAVQPLLADEGSRGGGHSTSGRERDRERGRDRDRDKDRDRDRDQARDRDRENEVEDRAGVENEREVEDRTGAQQNDDRQKSRKQDRQHASKARHDDGANHK